MVKVRHPYGGGHHGQHGHGPHQIHFLHPAANRHYYAWLPTSGQHREGAWMHFEPMGGREVGPGRIVGFQGHEVPRHLIPSDWPRMHFTPPPGHLRPPPPRPPMSIHHKPAIVAAPTHDVPGHWGWSKVLRRHVWIGAHQTSSEVNIKKLPPAQRAAARELMKAHGSKWAQAHTVAGIGGARSALIPGHWQFDHKTRDWKYVEQHLDRRISHAVHDAPPGAFGPRPHGLPFMHFWPTAAGEMHDGRNHVPSDAPTTIEIPAHARYAAAHGLLSPEHIRTVLGGAASAAGGQGVFAAAHPGDQTTAAPGAYGTTLLLQGIGGVQNLSTADQVKAQHYIHNIQGGLSDGDGARVAKYQALLASLARANHTRITY